MLFARRRSDERAFYFLGPADYVKHESELPMAITWRLRHPSGGSLCGIRCSRGLELSLMDGVMKIWVGVTDKDWFQFLSRINPDEVNFWQPSGSRVFRALQPGEPFLFKLHSPDNFIVGGGHFVRYSALPTSLAWDAFGPKNGVASLEALNARVRRYRREDVSIDPVIGCNVLAEPFFLAPSGLDTRSGELGAKYRAGQDLRYGRCRTAGRCGIPSRPRSLDNRKLASPPGGPRLL